MKHSFHIALLICTVFLSTAPQAAEVGERLPELSLKDAGGDPQSIDATVLRIYATIDRKGGKLMEIAMQGQDQATLDAQQAVAIANISAAPGFVRRIIRSILKGNRYATWVDESGNSDGPIKYREDRVTVLELEQLRITAIRFVADAEQLKQELQWRPAPEPDAAAAPEVPAAATTEAGVADHPATDGAQ